MLITNDITIEVMQLQLIATQKSQFALNIVYSHLGGGR